MFRVVTHDSSCSRGRQDDRSPTPTLQFPRFHDDNGSQRALLSTCPPIDFLSRRGDDPATIHAVPRHTNIPMRKGTDTANGSSRSRMCLEIAKRPSNLIPNVNRTMFLPSPRRRRVLVLLFRACSVAAFCSLRPSVPGKLPWREAANYSLPDISPCFLAALRAALDLPYGRSRPSGPDPALERSNVGRNPCLSLLIRSFRGDIHPGHSSENEAHPIRYRFISGPITPSRHQRSSEVRSCHNTDWVPETSG